MRRRRDGPSNRLFQLIDALLIEQVFETFIHVFLPSSISMSYEISLEFNYGRRKSHNDLLSYSELSNYT